MVHGLPGLSRESPSTDQLGLGLLKGSYVLCIRRRFRDCSQAVLERMLLVAADGSALRGPRTDITQMSTVSPNRLCASQEKWQMKAPEGTLKLIMLKVSGCSSQAFG